MLSGCPGEVVVKLSAQHSVDGLGPGLGVPVFAIRPSSNAFQSLGYSESLVPMIADDLKSGAGTSAVHPAVTDPQVKSWAEYCSFWANKSPGSEFWSFVSCHEAA